MAWQVFGTLTIGNQPTSLFDTLSGQIANCVVIPCNCGGAANAISLVGRTVAGATPPTISTYVDFMCFSFIAAANSTGNVTLQAFGLSSLPLYSAGGSAQAGSGAIVSGQLYIITYQSTLNGGNGGFVIVSAGAATLSIPVIVPQGGTGLTSLTAFAVLCGGTSGTNPVQPIASVGTSGQVLTSNGPGVLPTMQTPSAGGFSLLATLTANNSATLQDTTHITASFNVYMFVAENIIPVTNNTILKMRITENGGSTFPTTNYVATDTGINAVGSSIFNTNTDGFLLNDTNGGGGNLGTLSNTSLLGLCGTYYLVNPNSAANKYWYGVSYWNSAGTIINAQVGGAYTNDANVVNGVQFLMSSGNISSGKIRIYGGSL